MGKSGVVAVQPIGPTCSTLASPRVAETKHRRRLAARLISVASVVYNWLLWGFFTTLLFGQALGIAWTTVTSRVHMYFGQDPALGTYDVLGMNDTPFTDRSFVCSLRGGRVYRPVQLQRALESPVSVVIDTSGAAINGYRVVERSVLRFDSSAMTAYKNTCNAIAETISAIFDRCAELGYNVTRDALRVVVDDEARGASVMKFLPDTLPVIVMPFADNGLYSRYALPGWDGNACMLRLNGAYETEGYPYMTLRGLNRSVREFKTREFLQRHGGAWRNGWYEDLDGGRWYSDMLSSDKTVHDIASREFEMSNNTERDCINTDVCGTTIRTSTWSPTLHVDVDPRASTSITILNATHHGIFLYEASSLQTIESVYSLEVILANVSLGVLLLRWAVAMSVLLRSDRGLQSAGIGVLSCARGFHWLPIFLLSRLKTDLAVFATVGCTFEGSQLALSQAWFMMYPGIAELLFFVYSLLNLLAKLLRRRMSDALFGPTLLFYCLLHYYRTNLAQSGWLEYDGRIGTIMTPDEFKQLSILDFFRSDALLKLNGGVKSLFWIKIGVLGLNLVLLLVSKAPDESADTATTSDAEIVLGLRLSASGGLGTPRSERSHTPSRFGEPQRRPDQASKFVLTDYDLVRLGYVVLDDTWVIAVQDWLLFAVCTHVLTSVRVVVFKASHSSGEQHRHIESKPLLCRISDPQLRACQPWAIAARSFR